ncbi:glycosyltransferase [Microbulbifer sp. EKSA008]|uniref:glycosyltransferase n=1 Tax=Microbulbifer sp. EKSA008 TaxID=3243367 RepID=UPI00404141B6
MKNLIICPDYRATNPYLEEMYAELEGEYNIQYIAYNELDASLVNSDVFHLHWTSGVLAGAKTIYEAKFLKNAFIGKIRRYILKGGKFFWTVHNKLSHDSNFIEIEKELNEELTDLAHQVFVHNELAKDVLSADYFMNRKKISISEHGNYIGVYPNTISRAAARKKLGIKDSETVFLFLGQVRPYKGITDLVVSFSEIRKVDKNSKLIIAGKPVHPIKPGEISELYGKVDGIEIYEGMVEDESLELYFNAADFAVFPYRNILTSGSVLNAFSFSIPVIAPADGVLPEIIKDGENGFVYEKGSISGLISAMQKSLEVSLLDRALMKQRAKEYAENISWSNGANSIKFAYQSSSAPFKHLGDGARLIHQPTDTVSSPTLTVIILNYNCEKDVLKVVQSIRSQSIDFEYQIIIVDNKSTNINDNLLTHYFSDCHVIRLNTNAGYARGNNVGVRYAIDTLKSEYVLISNPDIEYLPNSISSLINYKKNIESDIVSPAILRDDTSQIWSAGGVVSFDEGVNVDHHYSGDHFSSLPSEPYEVEYAAGACLLFNGSLIDDIGYIPEDYFLYYEETDWCLEARRKDKKIVICPSVLIRHHKNSEPKGKPPKEYYLYYYIRNTFNFYGKFGVGDFEMLEKNLLERFINPWKERIKKSFPETSDKLNSLMDRAVLDGKAGISGKTLESEDDVQTDHLKIRLDSVTNDGIVHGWAINSLNPELKLNLDVFVDEFYVGNVTCDEFREDLVKAGVSGDGHHGYTFKIPKTYINGKKAVVSIRWREVDAINSPSTIQFDSFSASYKGRIDGISGGSLCGWLIDETNLFDKIKFKLFSDGRFLGVYSADNYREDLEKAFKFDGCHSLQVKLPMFVLDGNAHNIKVEAIDPDGKTIYLCERDVSFSLREPKTPEKINVFQDVNKWLYVHRSVYVQDKNYQAVKKYFESLKQGLSYDANRYFDRLSEKPLVSIIMPVFNRENVVLDAVSSILDQVYQEWELIIVDDGSNDRSVEVIKSSTNDHRISIYTLPENMGVSSARNVGLEKARGDFIAYLDSDNTWDKNYLSIMAFELEKNQSRECAYAGQLIHQTCNLTSGESLVEESFLRAGPFNQALVKNRNFIDLNAFMHRRSKYQSLGGFNERMRRLVDWELIVRYTNENRPLYVPALLSNYYMDLAENQITKLENYSDSLIEYKSSISGPDKGSPDASTASESILFLITECEDPEKLDITLAAIVASANFCNFSGSIGVVMASPSSEAKAKYSNFIDFFPSHLEFPYEIGKYYVCLLKSGNQLHPSFFKGISDSLLTLGSHCYVISKLSKYDKNVRVAQPYAMDSGFVDNTVSSDNWPNLKYSNLSSLNSQFVALSQIDELNFEGILVSSSLLERIDVQDNFEGLVSDINTLSHMELLTINVHDKCKVIQV